MINIDQELEDALTNRFKYGNAKGLQATADDYLKGVYAMLYDDVPDNMKTVPERDSWVKDRPEYHAAIEEKANRYANWEAARLKMQIIFAAVEKYRTDKATERDMMRAGQ
jgi:hypothetical protein